MRDDLTPGIPEWRRGGRRRRTDGDHGEDDRRAGYKGAERAEGEFLSRPVVRIAAGESNWLTLSNAELGEGFSDILVGPEDSDAASLR